MKKLQRVRFYALINRQSSGSALSAAEIKELAALATLAAAAPDPALDTEDEPAAPAAEPAPETEEEKKARLAKEKKAAEDAAAAKDTAASSPGISARLRAALSSLGGGTPATAAAQLATTRAELSAAQTALTQARADLASVRASLGSTEKALTALCDFLGIAPSSVAGQTQAQIDALCTAKIAAATVEHVASLGFAPGKLPTPSTSSTGDSKLLSPSEFAALTPAQKMAFAAAGGRCTA